MCESTLIYSQRLRIKQILINLASNAIKFTPLGEVSISAVVIDELLTLQVIDTGMGIPEDKRDYIFENLLSLNPLARIAYLKVLAWVYISPSNILKNLRAK